MNPKSIATALCTGIVAFTGTTQAIATPTTDIPQPAATLNGTAAPGEITLWSGAHGRKIRQTRGSLHLVLAPGDTVEVTADKLGATWKNREGIVLIEFDARLMSVSRLASLRYDKGSSILYAMLDDKSYDGTSTKYGCANKWVAWGWTVAWGGLVCAPFGVATG